MNKSIFTGNLTRDIELTYAASGTAIAKTAIAVSTKFTSNGEKKEDVMFMDVTLFGRIGEVANQYLRKGSKVMLEGRIQFDQWVDKETGAKRSKHALIVETMEMLDSKGATTSDEGEAPAPKAAPAAKPAAAAPKAAPAPLPEIDINEDEIPF